jgi:hypothetical protein
MAKTYFKTYSGENTHNTQVSRLPLLAAVFLQIKCQKIYSGRNKYKAENAKWHSDAENLNCCHCSNVILCIPLPNQGLIPRPRHGVMLKHNPCKPQETKMTGSHVAA